MCNRHFDPPGHHLHGSDHPSSFPDTILILVTITLIVLTIILILPEHHLNSPKHLPDPPDHHFEPPKHPPNPPDPPDHHEGA